MRPWGRAVTCASAGHCVAADEVLPLAAGLALDRSGCPSDGFIRTSLDYDFQVWGRFHQPGYDDTRMSDMWLGWSLSWLHGVYQMAMDPEARSRTYANARGGRMATTSYVMRTTQMRRKTQVAAALMLVAAQGSMQGTCNKSTRHGLLGTDTTLRGASRMHRCHCTRAAFCEHAGASV